jgi:hypothetical protein
MTCSSTSTRRRLVENEPKARPALRNPKLYLVKQNVTGLHGEYFSDAVVEATERQRAITACSKTVRHTNEFCEGGGTIIFDKDRITAILLADAGCYNKECVDSEGFVSFSIGRDNGE